MATQGPQDRRPPAPPVAGLGRGLLVGVAVAVLLAVAEVFVLIVIGRTIGWLVTILLVIATSLLGAWVLRREGPRSWRAFRADLRERRPPGASATDGLLVLVGGVLMVLPGFITDAVGALLVAPPTRRLARGVVQALLTRRLTPSAATTLFGPRTVRVRTGSTQAPPPPSAQSGVAGEPIEGEIIDPPPH